MAFYPDNILRDFGITEQSDIAQSFYYPLDNPSENLKDYITFTAFGGKVPGYTKIKTTGKADHGRALGTVQLYIPEQITNSQAANYQGTQGGSLAAAFGNAVGDNFEGEGISDALAGAFKTIQSLAAEGAQKAAEGIAGESYGVAAQRLGRTGAAANRHVLFDGLEYRTFTYQYNLMPKSEQESQMLTSMIKFFRTQMLPEPTFGGAFFQIPNYFQIKYHINGEADPLHLNKIKPSVLTQCEVQYGGNGAFGIFRDSGAPAVIDLSLTFQEVQLVTKSDAEQGY